MPWDRQASFKLEELSSDHGYLESFLSLFDVRYDAKVHWPKMQHPEHVKVPLDFPLTETQAKQFEEICGPMMQRMGYDLSEPEYRVKY